MYNFLHKSGAGGWVENFAKGASDCAAARPPSGKVCNAVLLNAFANWQ
jgi:hypothetical protein